MFERSAPIGRRAGPDGLSALLLEQLSAEYPDLSRRLICEAMNQARTLAGGSTADLMELGAAARGRLEALRSRSLAATRRVRLPAPGPPSVTSEGDHDDAVGLRGLGAGEASDPIRDPGAGSGFAGLLAALGDQGRLPGAPAGADRLCRLTMSELGIAASALSVSAGVLSASTLGAAGSLARTLEELQVVLGEGPSHDGLTHGCAVLVDDLSAPAQQARWPMYAPAALEQGARGHYVLPMQVGAANLGVLVLYLDRPDGLDAQALGQARILAGIALDWLIEDLTAPAAGEGYQPARQAFADYRPEIHQATGMVSVQLGVDLATALLRLRARAYAEDRGLSGLAAAVVARTVHFRDDPQDHAEPGREIV